MSALTSHERQASSGLGWHGVNLTPLDVGDAWRSFEVGRHAAALYALCRLPTLAETNSSDPSRFDIEYLSAQI